MKKEHILVLLLVISSFSFVILNYGGLYQKIANVHQMPLVYYLEDNTYLKNDFYVQETAGFNVRYYFSQAQFQVNKIFRNYGITQQVLSFMAILAIGLNLYFLALHFWGDGELGFFVAICLIFLIHFNPGRLNLISGYPSPNIFSYAFILGGLNLILRKKEILGYFVVGVAVLFQPIAGLLMYVSFFGSHCLVSLSYKKFRQCITSLLKSLSFFVSASLNLVPLFLLDIKTKMLGKENIVAFTLSKFRHFSHSSPFSWHPSRFLIYLPFVILAGILLFKHFKQERDRRYAFAYALITLGFLIIGTLFVEVWPNTIVAKAQLFRCLVFVTVASYIVIMIHIFFCIKHSKTFIEKGAYLFVPILFFEYLFVPLGLLALSMSLLPSTIFRRLSKRIAFNGWYRHLVLFGALPLLLVVSVYMAKYAYVTILAYGFISRFPLMVFLAVKVVLYVMVCIILFSATPRKCKKCLYLFFVFYLVAIFALVQTRDISARASCGLMYDTTEYIRLNTAEGSIFLIPPTWDQFRLCANRAVVVDITDVFTDSSIVKWHDRLSDVTKQERLTEKLDRDKFNRMYHENDEQDIEKLREKYDFGYVVMDNTIKPEEFDFPIFYRDSKVTVYKLKPESRYSPDWS